MLIDAHNNYTPTLYAPRPANIASPSSGGGGSGLAGSGSPVGTFAPAGTTYFDKLTGNFWVNQDGTAANWTILIS